MDDMSIIPSEPRGKNNRYTEQYQQERETQYKKKKLGLIAKNILPK